MNAELILKKIHEGPYWRVLIEPTEFDPNRVQSLARAAEIIQRSVVELRGWDYPHVDTRRGGIERQDRWIESGIDWENNVYEYWRLYLSGQFIHHFSSIERFHQLNWQPAPEHYILLHNTLFTVTEIYQFAASLAREGVLRPGAITRIELHNIQDHVLTRDDLGGALGMRGYVARTPQIELERSVGELDLRTRAAELAQEDSIAVFERFGFDLSPQEIALEQGKLLERRLGR